jgi:hypothetical protein
MISLSIINSFADTGDLLIKGEISEKNCSEGYLISKSEMDSLPQSVIVTGTSWTARSKFEGVKLSTILERAGAHGKTLSFHALNDYEVDIPTSDVNNYGVILAARMNNQPLSIRTFGPYFVIYPRDDFRQTLGRPEYLARFIWQVDQITVKK